MSTLINDLKYGMRMLVKRPAFTAIVVLVLAVGIGANTALFSVFKTVVLSPLPFPQPERIMFVNSTVKGLENMISGPDYVDWREQNQVFSTLCAVQLDQRYTLTGAGSPRVMRGWEVTTDFHQVLGVRFCLKTLPREKLTWPFWGIASGRVLFKATQIAWAHRLSWTALH